MDVPTLDTNGRTKRGVEELHWDIGGAGMIQKRDGSEPQGCDPQGYAPHREVSSRDTMYWLIHIVVPPGDTQQQMQADVNIGGVTLSNLWDYLQWALTAEEKGSWMFLQYLWKTRERSQ